MLSRAYKCDICGKLYERYDGIKIQDNGNRYCRLILANDGCAFSTTFDTCPDCMTFITDFVRELRKKDA